MIAAIKYNLANLTNFAGRDARPTFWWYVLFLIILQFLAGMVVSLPMVFGAMGSAFDAASSGADQVTLQSEMMANMADQMGTTIWISAVLEVIMILLLVAAFVRRIHDTGNSGYWAVIPVVTQLISIVMNITLIDEVKAMMLSASDPIAMQEMQSQITTHWSNFLGWIGLLVVIVFGLLKSQAGANRYGEEPVALGN